MTTRERTLARAIRAARVRHQLTQRQLAERIGANQSAVSFWESGVESPTVEHLIALAAELPDIVESFAGRERELLRRLLRLERELYGGRCVCAGCTCGS